MSNRSVNNRRSILWLTMTLVFTCLGQTWAPCLAASQRKSTEHSLVVQYAHQQRRPVRPRTARPSTTPTNDLSVEDDRTDETIIVSERERLNAQKLQEQKAAERELLTKNEPAKTRSDELWQNFRQTFAFHSQVIAASEPESDNSRTLIISEPPPHVTLANILLTIGGDFVLRHQVKKQAIGYDGWVKDVVVAVKGNDSELQSILSRLHQQLFFTSYKSYTLKLPLKISPRPADMNLTVTPDEIKRWVVDDGERFIPVEGGTEETLSSLAAEESSGVYISRQRGLVGWWIPKSRNIYDCRIPARQFTIDADLILGALANRSGIFIVGREREVPVDVLPPLRFETLALLADVQRGQQGSLAQSYERRHEFAGRIEGGNDWAPILLSPELRDTEYGSLLNITDQLLKGWSNHGETTYHNFAYSDPGRFPFPKPLWAKFAESNKGTALTYNWNTKGVGYTVSFGSVNAIAFNRTGSLPVSYIPEGFGRASDEVVSAEDTGYEYFSTLNDPNLVRVVQYAALYQIFSAFNLAHSSVPIATDKYPDEQLVSLTTALNAELRQLSDADLALVAQQTATSLQSAVDEMIQQQLSEQADDIKQRIEAKIRAESPELNPNTPAFRERYQREFNELRKFASKKAAESIIDDVRDQLRLVKLNQPPVDRLGTSLRTAALSQFASFKRMPQRYAESVDRRATNWIHTPVIVISRNSGPSAVGGHNLDARVSKIGTDSVVQRGNVEIDYQGNLIVNPVDAPRARGLARALERRGLMRELALALRENVPSKIAAVRSEMNEVLRSAEVQTVRTRESALQFATIPPNKPPVNKPPISTGEAGPSGQVGWGGNGRDGRAIPVGLRRDSNTVRIVQAENGRFNVEFSKGTRNETFQLQTLVHEDAVDAAAWQATRRAKPGEQVAIEFQGVPEQRVRATLNSIQIRMGERGEAVQVVGYMVGGDGPASSTTSVRQFNFRQAELSTSEITPQASGDFQQKVSLNVPKMNSTAERVSFSTEVTFQKGTPREVVAAVTGRLSRAYNNLAARWNRLQLNRSYQADMSTYHKNLSEAARKVKAKSKLDFDVKTTINVSVGQAQGLGDAYIFD